MACSWFSIELDGLSRNELISAINYVNSEPGLIYGATNYGKVFRIAKINGYWKPTLIQADVSLPPLYIWDISFHA